jgi:3,5-epimerase/4-reductase
MQAPQAESLMLFGKTGWIGNHVANLLRSQGHKVYMANSRLENRDAVGKELDQYQPTYVLNCAGVTGKPSIDWCEDHKPETIRSNVIGALQLADLCFLRGIPLTVYSTGCVYTYNDKHPMGSGIGFKEEEPPNYYGSFYSRTKIIAEDLLKEYPNVLVLRLRMPISDDLHPRSLVTKLTHYSRVVNIPNSMTILTDMLPISIIMTRRGLRGIFNFTNPGVLSHNELLDLYAKEIDPSFKYENFSEEEQAKVLKAGRCNNELDMSKLARALPDVHLPHIKESIVQVFKRMRANLQLPLPSGSASISSSSETPC